MTVMNPSEEKDMSRCFARSEREAMVRRWGFDENEWV